MRTLRRDNAKTGVAGKGHLVPQLHQGTGNNRVGVAIHGAQFGLSPDRSVRSTLTQKYNRTLRDLRSEPVTVNSVGHVIDANGRRLGQIIAWNGDRPSITDTEPRVVTDRDTGEEKVLDWPIGFDPLEPVAYNGSGSLVVTERVGQALINEMKAASDADDNEKLQLYLEYLGFVWPEIIATDPENYGFEPLNEKGHVLCDAIEAAFDPTSGTDAVEEDAEVSDEITDDLYDEEDAEAEEDLVTT